jgi:hypothetical protein
LVKSSHKAGRLSCGEFKPLAVRLLSASKRSPAKPNSVGASLFAKLDTQKVYYNVAALGLMPHVTDRRLK